MANELKDFINNFIEEEINNINNEGNEIIQKYEYGSFSNFSIINASPYGNVYTTTWENSTVVLKSITIDTSIINSEIVCEIKNNIKSTEIIPFETTINNKPIITKFFSELNAHPSLVDIYKHKHPNIIQFYGVTSDPLKNQYYLILQYAADGNLRDYLRMNFKKLEWTDKLRYAHEITNGLSFLHDNRIIHKNLHSKNILVHNQRMLIADFGLSKHMNEATMFKASEMLEYLDPQCFLDIRYKCYKKSDIYSLGVIFLEISSGRKPYYSFENRVAMIIHVANGGRETPVENTPKNFCNLYQRCWDQDPEKRPEIKIVLEELKNMRIDDQKAFHEKWIESKVIEGKINEHNIDEFEDYKFISDGAFSKVYRARYKSTKNICALKFIEKNNHTNKELVNELDYMLSIESHENIIKFHGITYEIDRWDPNIIEYVLILEYADNGTLRDYLQKNSTNIEWELKVQFAIQLVEAVKWLHVHNIVHGDLHPNNILIHQEILKLADFGLSRRVIESSMSQTTSGVIPYIDPQCFITERSQNGNFRRYRKNKKSDIYSIGVTLWEISTEKQPFKNEDPASLPTRIRDGLREKSIPDTPLGYVRIYKQCWQTLQDDRPSIEEVAMMFEGFIVQNITENDNFDIFDSSRFEEFLTNALGNINFNSELDATAFGQDEMTLFVYNLYSTFSNLFNEGKSVRDIIINYISQSNKSNEEVFQWLLANSTHPRNICLLGLFYRWNIGTDENSIGILNLFVDAANKGDHNAQYFAGRCYAEGLGGTDKDKRRAIEWYTRAAENKCAAAEHMLGEYFYKLRKYDRAFYYLKRATENGNYKAMFNVGICYEYGFGVEKDEKKAFEYFKKSAEMGHPNSMYYVGEFYRQGIIVEKNIDIAFDWYLKLAITEQDTSTKKLEFFHWIPYDKFEIIEEIDKGAFSTVFKAKYLNRNGSYKIVAIKIVKDSNKNQEAFLNELKAYHSLSQYLGISRDEKTNDYILVLNYAKYGSLSKNLSNIFKFEWKIKLKILHDIVSNLYHIHSKGYLHRDLHPGNILLKENYEAYITDLGLSKPLDEKEQEGRIHGVLPYVAPELLQKKSYTEASDIYSFGIIMVEMTTGKRSFNDYKFDNHLAEKRPNIIEIITKLDEWLKISKGKQFLERIIKNNSENRIKKKQFLASDEISKNSFIISENLNNTYTSKPYNISEICTRLSKIYGTKPVSDIVIPFDI
ncbi:kinase-like domain-containing protein [Gigaspora rosea]|uniref:Kinase-like domain-containing protein n=1 Tax=Gigaspora rosea TaxID=44941 RepID=A0A397W613_9GLOM|nr:kinase-like domain-containing protein [Gigaspora rosea]